MPISDVNMQITPSKHTTHKMPCISLHTLPQSVFIEIATPRLYIRSYLEEDYDNCISLYSDKAIISLYDHGKPRSENEVRALIDERGYQYKNELLGLFSIFDAETKSFIGQADILPLEESGSVELGCILFKQYQSKGFSSEIVGTLLFDYINKLNQEGYEYNGSPIKKVIATAHPDNIPSNKLIKKLGMTFFKKEARFGNPRLWYFYIPNTVT